MNLIADPKNRLSKEEVMAIVPPEPTKSWNPISHGSVIKSIEEIIEKNGIGVMDESYSVANSGHNMFATMTLDAPLGDGSFTQIGIRNSTNKKFAVGICAGTRVTVCENLMFSGEFMEYRKHTSGLNMGVLDVVADAAFKEVFKQSKELYDWHQSLHIPPFNEENLKSITFDALKSGIIPPNRFKHFLECYQEELKLTGNEHGLYEWHGGVTRMNKGLNLFTVSGRTSQLNVLCDEYKLAVAA